MLLSVLVIVYIDAAMVAPENCSRKPGYYQPIKSRGRDTPDTDVCFGAGVGVCGQGDGDGGVWATAQVNAATRGSRDAVARDCHILVRMTRQSNPVTWKPSRGHGATGLRPHGGGDPASTAGAGDAVGSGACSSAIQAAAGATGAAAAGLLPASPCDC